MIERGLIGFLAVFFLLAVAGQGGVSAGSLGAAQADLQAMRLPVARQALSDIVSDKRQSTLDRSDAALLLADISARIDGDGAAALAWLDLAKSYGASPKQLAGPTVRALVLNGDPRQAVTVAVQARKLAIDPPEQAAAMLLYGRSMVAAFDDPNVNLARRALAINSQEVRITLDANPDNMALAELLFDFSLRLGDGDTILSSWQAIYDDAGYDGAALYPDAYQALQDGLRGWLGSTLAVERRRAIVLALAQTHFYQAAVWLANDHPERGRKAFLAEPEIAEIMAYVDFLDGLKAGATAIYRRRANGAPDVPDAFDAEFDRLGAAFVALVPAAGRQDLAITGKKKKSKKSRNAAPEVQYDRESFIHYIGQKFSARLHFAEDGQDIQYGHEIVHENKLVKQYGLSAAVALTKVDFMAVGGYAAFLQGESTVGQGWSDEQGVVVLRGGAAGMSAGGLWQRCGPNVDVVARGFQLRDIAQGDLPLLADKESIAYLPGLAKRLEWQGCVGLMRMLKQAELEGDHLRNAFLGESQHALTEAKLGGYDARKVIDQVRLGDAWDEMSEEDREFYALLAQVALAPQPRWALLDGIFIPGVGGETIRGRAAGRLVFGLLAWMKSHQKQVVAFDASKPLLVQLDHLSDDQIRAAALSMDSFGSEMAKQANGQAKPEL